MEAVEAVEAVNSFCLFCNPLDGQWSLTRSSEWWVFKARYILQLISGPQMAKDPCQGLAPARMLFRDRFFSDTLNISMVKTSVSTQSFLSVWWLLAWTMSCNLSSPSGSGTGCLKVASISVVFPTWRNGYGISMHQLWVVIQMLIDVDIDAHGYGFMDGYG